MEGVTILAVNEAVGAIQFNWIMAIIIFLMTLLVGLLQGMADRMVGLGILLGVVFGLVFGTLMGFVTSQSARPETYKVTISDTVNFNEFNEHYKIINQEGLIYTITERTEE